MATESTYYQKLSLCICLILASYMTYTQVKSFFDNEDQASVSYLQFDAKDIDQYPTFTICLTVDTFVMDGLIFEDDPDLWGYGPPMRMFYEMFLMGIDTDFEEKLDSIDFDSAKIDIFSNGVVKGMKSIYKDGGKEIEENFPKENSTRFPLEIVHQDPRRICYSKMISKTMIAVQDIVHFSTDALNTQKLDVLVYVHQAGQFYRHFTYSSFHMQKMYLLKLGGLMRHKTGYRRKFSLSGFEVVRRRVDAKIPCNRTIENEDGYVRQEIMKRTGCIPAYWKRFIVNSSLHTTLPGCNQTQYNQIFRLMEYEKIEPNQFNLYPCNVTNAVVQLSTEEHVGYDMNDLQFRYTTDWYKEFVNKKAFSMETMWCQVGGFAGIFHIHQ